MKIKIWFLIPLFVLIFSPIFLVHFGTHTDGYLITTPKGDWMGDPEGGVLFKQGRPLWTYLDSFIGWHVKSVEDLTVLRICVFLIKILTCYFLYRFCCRIGSGDFWAVLIAFCFALLPDNIINVMWVSNGAPESVSLLFGILSYLNLDKCESLKPKWNLAAAIFFFLIALLIYQPMAVIVFGFMFLRLFFQEYSSWEILRLRLIAEICFYGVILVLYWYLIKNYIIPFSQHFALPATVGSMYQVDLVKNVATKIPLIIDLIKYSLIGTWDLILHDQPFYEWSMIAVFGAIMAFFFVQRRFSFTPFAINVSIQKFIFACTLFLLANAPGLMAINYTMVTGYRTFLSCALMGLGFVIYCFKYTYSLFQNRFSKRMTSCLIGVYFLSIILVAAWTIHQSLRNYLKEYDYLNNIASHIDYNKTDKIIVVLNRPGETLIDYDLPFEFSYMTTIYAHCRYIFDKYSYKAGKQMIFQDAFIDWPLYIDDYTQIVDLTLLRRKKSTYARPANKTRVHVTDAYGQKILVQQMNGGDEGPVLLFKQDQGNAFWRIKPGTPEGRVDYFFMDMPERVVGYRLGAACLNAQDRPCSFSWQIQGSVDNNNWANMSFQSMNNLSSGLEGAYFDIPANFPLKYLRFIFLKQNALDVLSVGALQLKSYEMRTIN